MAITRKQLDAKGARFVVLAPCVSSITWNGGEIVRKSSGPGILRDIRFKEVGNPGDFYWFMDERGMEQVLSFDELDVYTESEKGKKTPKEQPLDLKAGDIIVHEDNCFHLVISVTNPDLFLLSQNGESSDPEQEGFKMAGGFKTRYELERSKTRIADKYDPSGKKRDIGNEKEAVEEIIKLLRRTRKGI